MEDFFKEWIEEINSQLNEGYSFDELKESDKWSVMDYLLGVNDTLSGFDTFYNEDSTIEKIMKEISEDIEERCKAYAISGACRLIYSIMDGDEDYYEKDPI